MRIGEIFAIIVMVVISALPSATQAAPSKRVALVVGVSAYENTHPLANPERDATGVAASLKALGFDVTMRLNVDQEGFGDALITFEKKLAGADAALFYFAGHGLQVGEENYLLSADAKADNPYLIDRDGVKLNRVLDIMESRATISIAMIDACRDNPLANALRKSSGEAGRSLGLSRGLASINSTFGNSLVAFATAPGAIALDGAEANSPFTKALLSHLAAPELEISTMLKRVTRDVMQATDGKQRPEVVASMSDEFYFVEQNVSVEGDLVVEISADKTEERAASLLEVARSMPSGKPRITSLQLVQSQFPDTAVAGMAGILIEQEMERFNLTADEVSVEKFDRTLLGALDVDKALEDASAQSAKTSSALTPEQIEQGLGLHKEDTKRIQIALGAMGYDLGTADGAFGPKSRQALKLFQLRQQVPQSGYLNKHTINALLNALNDAPKNFDGLWTMSFIRVATQDLPNGGDKKGKRVRLVNLKLRHANDTFYIEDYEYFRPLPADPFHQFSAGINKKGSLRLSTDVSILSGKLRVATLKATFQMPKIAINGASFGFNANLVEEGYFRLYVELKRN